MCILLYMYLHMCLCMCIYIYIYICIYLGGGLVRLGDRCETSFSRVPHMPIALLTVVVHSSLIDERFWLTV